MVADSAFNRVASTRARPHLQSSERETDQRGGALIASTRARPHLQSSSEPSGCWRPRVPHLASTRTRPHLQSSARRPSVCAVSRPLQLVLDRHPQSSPHAVGRRIVRDHCFNSCSTAPAVESAIVQSLRDLFRRLQLMLDRRLLTSSVRSSIGLAPMHPRPSNRLRLPRADCAFGTLRRPTGTRALQLMLDRTCSRAKPLRLSSRPDRPFNSCSTAPAVELRTPCSSSAISAGFNSCSTADAVEQPSLAFSGFGFTCSFNSCSTADAVEPSGDRSRQEMPRCFNSYPSRLASNSCSRSSVFRELLESC